MNTRDVLVQIYLDYLNNYLSPAGYAEQNSLTIEQATALLAVVREVARSEHPEA